MKAGLGRETRPVQGDIVNVRYEGKLDDETIVDKHNDIQMILGDADIIQGTVVIILLLTLVLSNLLFCFYYNEHSII